MKIREIIKIYEEKFSKLSQSPRLDAELLIRRALGDVDRLYLLMNLDREVDENNLKKFKSMANERLKHRPVAYILGKREFMGLNFYVKEGVLIPRPDTEILVERSLELIDKLKEEQAVELNKDQAFELNQEHVAKLGQERIAVGKNMTSEYKHIQCTNNDKVEKDSKLKVLDIGTGSGAIAISIKYYRNDVDVKAVDISDTALEIANLNNKIVDNSVDFIKSDLFENLNDEKFDLIISNPPYIRENQRPELDRQVLDYEPNQALFAKDEGLYFYKKISDQARTYLNKGARLIFELGHDQSDQVKEILKDLGYVQIKLTYDLQGFARVIEGKIV